MKPLTPQQANVLAWANRGYPAAQIGQVLGISPAQVADQVGLIRKKGYDVELVSAVEARRINRAEAERIARDAT